MQYQSPTSRIADQPSFTLAEAAAVTGLSRVTIRRYLDAGRFPNAFRDDSTPRRPAPWRVPRADLSALGRTLREPQMHDHGVSPSPATEKSVDLALEAAVGRAVVSECRNVIVMLLEQNRGLLRLVERLALGRGADAAVSEEPQRKGDGAVTVDPKPSRVEDSPDLKSTAHHRTEN